MAAVLFTIFALILWAVLSAMWYGLHLIFGFPVMTDGVFAGGSILMAGTAFLAGAILTIIFD